MRVSYSIRGKPVEPAALARAALRSDAIAAAVLAVRGRLNGK